MVQNNKLPIEVQRIIRVARRIVADTLIILVAHIVASQVFGDGAMMTAWPFMLLMVLVYVAFNAVLSFYNRMWGVSGPGEPLLIVASTVTAAVTLLLLQTYGRPYFNGLGDRELILGQSGMILVGFLAVRYRYEIWDRLRFWDRGRKSRSLDGLPTRALIVGTTWDAQHLALRMLREASRRYEVVGFLDDDLELQGLVLAGVPVVGTTWDVVRITKERSVDLIAVTEQQRTRAELNNIVELCQQTDAQIKILPDGIGLLDNRDWDLRMLRDVTPDDLLAREPVETDHESCHELIAGAVVLVTGASGSIGSELSRQIAACGPARLVLVDNNESDLHDLTVELRSQPEAPTLRPVLADITNGAKVQAIFEEEHPDLVFHAAAYKHVPMLEIYPEEAVRVNLLGTLILSELAARYNTKRFVFISTDKAVHPSSVMGATKRLCEMWLESLNHVSANTLFTAVRFGNVLGSRGSVVPLFRRQIDWGGPVTVTHPDMTRYFMTIPEAVSLVLHAASLSGAGRLFMLNMGEQVSIRELAERMIRLRGLRVGKDIAIQYTGIRPGEKLEEELSYGDEIRELTDHPRLYQLHSSNGHDIKRVLGAFLILLSAAQATDRWQRLKPALLATSNGDWDAVLPIADDLDLYHTYQTPIMLEGCSLLASPEVFRECMLSSFSEHALPSIEMLPAQQIVGQEPSG